MKYQVEEASGKVFGRRLLVPEIENQTASSSIFTTPFPLNHSHHDGP